MTLSGLSDLLFTLGRRHHDQGELAGPPDQNALAKPRDSVPAVRTPGLRNDVTAWENGSKPAEGEPEH